MYGILLTSRWIGFFNIVKYTHLTWVFLHQLQNFTNKKQKNAKVCSSGRKQNEDEYTQRIVKPSVPNVKGRL